MKRIIAFLLCLVLAFSLISCRKLEGDKNGKEDGDKEETSQREEYIPSATALAAWSESTSVTEDMYVYYFNSYYRGFLESYGSNIGDIGLDPTKPLSSQAYSEDYTWHEYITLLVYNNLREMLALCDAAKDAGLALTEEDNKEFEEQMAAYAKEAEEIKMELSEYIELIYGKGVTEETVRKANELRYLANAYYDKLHSEYSFTDEDLRKYYEENRFAYLHFDCIKVTVPAEDADDLKNATDEESFVAAMRKSITDSNFLGDYDTFSELIEEQIQRKYYKRSDYSKSSPLSKWVAEEDRKPYDTFSKKESSGDVTVVMVLPPDNQNTDSAVLYRDELPLKNLKYIYFPTVDGEETTALSKAEALYNEWLKNPTEENFDSLMADNISGKSENVDRNDYDNALSDWMFESGRRAGDCAYVKVPDGAYIVYILEDGEESWLLEVRNTLIENKYAEDVNKLITLYPTEYNADFFFKVNEVSLVLSGS